MHYHSTETYKGADMVNLFSLYFFLGSLNDYIISMADFLV